MADEEYNKKLESLQQYIPFLNNMIAQLKDPRKKNREQQLAKMVSLHSMITDKKKKLKLETLIKCEDVILKLYDKVKSGSQSVKSQLPQQNVQSLQSSIVLSPITPSSPSPPRDIPKTKPVVIPTEKIDDPPQRESIMCPPTDTYKNRIDIYSSAADSLINSSASQKKSVFDRLGKKAPDMSKPPISLEDLAELQENVVTERMSLNELTDLREKLQRQLKTETNECRTSSINTTVRNTTILTKKAVEKSTHSDSTKVKTSEKSSTKSSIVPKQVKVIKEGSSIFGSALSSIDNKILEEAIKAKDKEKTKDRRNSKDEKKESSSSSHKCSKDGSKSDRKSSEHKSKEKKEEKSSKDRSKDRDRKKSDDTKKEDETKSNISTEETKPSESAPVYKRLADKYNPKPRKPSTETSNTSDISKKPGTGVIDNSLKVIENSAKTPLNPIKTEPTYLPLTVPLVSPTNSSHSNESDLSNQSNRSALFPIHPIPTITSSVPPQMNYQPNPMMNQYPNRPYLPHFQQPNEMGRYPPPAPQWGNSPMKPYPPRPFKPPPSPYNNPMQNLDYYPPGSTPIRQTFNHQPPPLLSPQFDNYEPRPPRRPDDWRQRPRENYRDPRLQQREPYRPMPPRRDSRDQEHNRKDPRLHRTLFEQEETKSEDNTTFASPLDSLYSGDNERKTGKGYGVQNFKIPKLKKEDESEEKKESETVELPVETKSIDENVASSVSSSTEYETKDEKDEPKITKDSVDEITSTNDIQENQTRDETKLVDNSQTDIINRFLKKLLENERTRAAASLFIDNVSNSLDDEKLKMVVQTVKSASSDNDNDDDERKKKLLLLQRRKKKLFKAKLLAKKKLLVKKKMRSSKQRSNKVKQDKDKESKEENDEIVMSVAERTKSRKRMTTKPSPTKKRVRHKTELDLLHEDIQDMFIRDGVLTATGKRMCRLLKNDESNKPLEPKRRTTRSTEKMNTNKMDSDKLKAMSNVRVLIPKIPFEKLAEVDEENQRYSLRRSNKSSKSYTEVDSDTEDKVKDSVEEEKEVEEEEQKEGDTEDEPEKTVEVPKRVRKRTKSWASGILPKRKKKTIDTTTETKEKLDYIEPDKSYYFAKSWNNKFHCKLCDFDGLNITKHYRTKHPDSEVLSSRLSQEKAEIAIKNSIDLNLEENTVCKLLSTKRFRFICRFCDTEMNSLPLSFYDHITTHTGEYRHLCTKCDFMTCNKKQLRKHCMKMHNGYYYNRQKWTKSKIYGYICGECNFVQMTKKSVEDHVNVYHLGEGKKIYKIHLSKYDDELMIKEKENTKDENAPKAKRKKPNEKKMKKDDAPLLVKKEKQIDMTVFTCNTDIQEENEKIELERLQKMTELNESVKTNRQSLSFVEQLSNRLLQEEKEEEVVTIKSEPIDDLDLKPESAKKPSKIIESTVTSVPEVVQKDNTIIQGMIQKLQGILKEENKEVKCDNGPPPLFPLVDKPIDDTKAFLTAGFLNICKIPEGLEYICRVPSCLFVTQNRADFLNHWNEDHTIVNQSFKMTICRICQREIKSDNDNTLLMNFFSHVENEHLCGILTTLNIGLIIIDRLRDGYEYGCRAIKCVFRTSSREVLIAHFQEIHKNYKITSTKCGICKKTIESDDNVFMKLLNHVEDEHLRDEESPYIIRTRRLSGDKLSLNEDGGVLLAKTDENPFPFKITGVMSLAESPLPPLSPISDNKKPIVESVVLKESKFNSADKIKIWKCPEALRKFIQCPRELYKCPQFSCKYCTSFRHLFEGHIKSHTRSNDDLVSCVYCDIKTPISNAGLHIDLRHSNCLYSCSQCLYRAVIREYVVIHNKKYHNDNDVIINLSPKTAKTIMMKGKEFTVQEACPPYVCGFNDCKNEFLFLNEFCTHFQNGHGGIMICGFDQCSFQCLSVEEALEHWNTHNCWNFHCLICKFGSMELYPMLEHYSTMHSNKEPLVVDRRKSPKMNQTYGYNSEAFAAVKYPKEELLESVNIQQFTIQNQSENLTLVPLSEKQIINLTPSFVFNTDEEKKPEETSNTDTETTIAASGDESDSQDVPNLKSFGLIGYQLFLCAFCDISFSNAKNFKSHVVHSKQCRDTKNSLKPFKCVHCQRVFKNPNGLLEHIQYHGYLRFGCSLCVKKFPSLFSLKLHMRNKHNVTNTVTTPLIPSKTNPEIDEFVLRPVQLVEPEIAKETTVQTLGQKSTYSPDEIDQLPKSYIFKSNIKCALCSYSTKVRTNLVRHLQFHSAEKAVPDIAPVNPVPCLDKNERMFDKMTNLAISSMTGRMGGAKSESKGVKEEKVEVPAYVPSNRRYVCCAEGCNYLCLQEANLRHHLYALHVQEAPFTCAHCKINLKTDIEGFLKHLKLHDLHLYKCSLCSFVHNLRHKVDKHAVDKHPDKMASTVTVRALETEILEIDQLTTSCSNSGEITPPTSIKKPWHCGMCKYKCANQNDIASHIFNKHDINCQFKCTLCSYKTDEKDTFNQHFKENHPSNDIDIIYVYYKNEGGMSSSNQKQFDTTPLWQRDRPRVRHIRGILFEETTHQKKKSTGRMSTSSASNSTPTNLDIAIEAVAKGEDTLSTNEKVIVIEDDEDDDDDDDNDDDEEVDVINDSGENKLLIDLDNTSKADVKVEENKELLTEETLLKKYGNYCEPNNRLYKCPICLKFKSKRVTHFVYHLLQELNCYRFKCKICDFSSVTFDVMMNHCQINHKGKVTNYVQDTPLEKPVEYWLQLILKYQSKILIQQFTFSNGEDQSSSNYKVACDYCNRWFKNVFHLKEHEIYHWAEHNYICSHCRDEFQSMDDLFQHSFLTHSSFGILFETNGPYVSKLISTLKAPPISVPPTQSTSSSNQDEMVYACSHCTEFLTTMDLFKKHVNECHEENDVECRIVPRSKVEIIYCCKYCREKGSQDVLKKHHEEQHSEKTFFIYQYICMECSDTFRNLRDVRNHFSTTHLGKKLCYTSVENKKCDVDEQFCCMKCPFTSSTLGGVRSHLRKHVRPIDCLNCGATFVYPTDARMHHSKEHSGKEEKIAENKDRLKEYEDLVKKIVAAKDKERRKVVPRKMLARKSTGAPFIRDGGS